MEPENEPSKAPGPAAPGADPASPQMSAAGFIVPPLGSISPGFFASNASPYFGPGAPSPSLIPTMDPAAYQMYMQQMQLQQMYLAQSYYQVRPLGDRFCATWRYCGLVSWLRAKLLGLFGLLHFVCDNLLGGREALLPCAPLSALALLPRNAVTVWQIMLCACLCR